MLAPGFWLYGVVFRRIGANGDQENGFPQSLAQQRLKSGKTSSLHRATVSAARVEKTQHYDFIFDQIRIETDLPSILVAQDKIGNFDFANASNIELYQSGSRSLRLAMAQVTGKKKNNQAGKDAALHLNLTSAKRLLVLPVVGNIP